VCVGGWWLAEERRVHVDRDASTFLFELLDVFDDAREDVVRLRDELQLVVDVHH